MSTAFKTGELKRWQTYLRSCSSYVFDIIRTRVFSFKAHLNRQFKLAFLITPCPSSVSPANVNFTLVYLLHNHYMHHLQDGILFFYFKYMSRSFNRAEAKSFCQKIFQYSYITRNKCYFEFPLLYTSFPFTLSNFYT